MGQGPQGQPGIDGFPGDPGDQGEQGLTGNQGPDGDVTASIDYKQITQELTSKSDYVSSLSKTILNSNKKFTDSITSALVNDKLLNDIKESLVMNDLFQTNIARELINDPNLKKQLKGSKGEIINIDYDILSSRIMTAGYLPTLTETIINDPDNSKQLINAIEIGKSLTTAVETIQNNPTFAYKIAKSIINNSKLLSQIKGDTGPSMDITQSDWVKQILFQNPINKCTPSPIISSLNTDGVYTEYNCIDPTSTAGATAKNTINNKDSYVKKEDIDYLCNQNVSDCNANRAIIWCDNNKCVLPSSSKGININNNATIADDDWDLHITHNNKINLTKDTTFSTSTVNVNGNVDITNVNFLPLQNKWALVDNGNMDFRYSDDGKTYNTKAYIDSSANRLHVNAVKLGDWSIVKENGSLSFKYKDNYKAHISPDGNINSWKNIGTNTGVKFNGDGGWWIRPDQYDKNWLVIGKDGYGSGYHTVFGSAWGRDRFQIHNKDHTKHFYIYDHNQIGNSG